MIMDAMDNISSVMIIFTHSLGVDGLHIDDGG